MAGMRATARWSTRSGGSNPNWLRGTGVWIVLALVMLGIGDAEAQFVEGTAKSSVGDEFWIAFPGNAFGADEIYVYVEAKGDGTKIMLEFDPDGAGPIVALALESPLLNAGSSHQFVLPFAGSAAALWPGGPFPVSAANSPDIQANNTVEHKGIHLTRSMGTAPFSAYGFSTIVRITADAYLALPINVLGTTYIVAAHSDSGTVAGAQGSEFVIVAAEPGTFVDITLTFPLDPAAPGIPRLAGPTNTYQVSLPLAGDTYVGRTAEGTVPDLTGTVLSANKPIAVFSGNRCGNVPSAVETCDWLMEQLPPTIAWGEQFLFVPQAVRAGGDKVRVLAQNAGTKVFVDNVQVATLAAGGFY